MAGGPAQGSSYSRSRVDPDESIEWLAWLMDGSIKLPGGFSIGLDPIIGLVPGVGDLIGTLVSSAIVLQAQRAGIPKATLMRMIANVAIDSVVGAIPFLGDVFDFAFKANAKNLELYRSARTGVRDTSRDKAFLGVVIGALALILTVPVLAIIWLVQQIF
jgi:hypothetical protein